ncbi:MAG: ATP-binding protein [Clostridia bacterium]|nr:ATP-binding protein [Clostridia bacterium]
MNIHNVIKREYEKKQLSTHHDLLNKKAEVYSIIPRLEEIEHEIRLLGVKYNKLILMNMEQSKEAMNELTKKIQELQSEKELLLTGNGYALNYLEPEYSCEKCCDTGFYYEDNVHQMCSCYKQQLIEHLYLQSNLGYSKNESFSCFDDSFYPDVIDERKYAIKKSPRENILEIRKKCLDFIENFHSPETKNLFFSGPAGVGKTYMANCIAFELLNKGLPVLYLPAALLFDTIAEYKYEDSSESSYRDEKYNLILNVDLLIIDDLGTEKPSASRYSELLSILNARQVGSSDRQRKTIISSNLRIKDLYEYYTDRVASRIVGNFDIYRFVGEDIRTLKKLTGR